MTPEERLAGYRAARANLPGAIRAAKADGMSVSEIARLAGVDRTTVYRMLGAKDAQATVDELLHHQASE